MTPVVMIGYDRARTLSRSLECLSKCENVQGRVLRLYLDAPYRPEDVEACGAMYKLACEMRDGKLKNLEIIRREKNYGVPGNLLAAMRTNLDEYGRVIFFEDDVCVSHTFLKYMDDALDAYAADKRIFCINGYQSPYVRIPRSYKHDVYLTPRNMAWGFGIWKDRWEGVDFEMKDWDEFRVDARNFVKLNDAGVDLKALIESQIAGRIHTWDVQCSYHMVKNGLYAVEPRYGLTKNIGFGQGGVHCCSKVSAFDSQKYYNFNPKIATSLLRDPKILYQLKYSNCNPRLFMRVFRKLKRIVWGLGPSHDEPVDVK